MIFVIIPMVNVDGVILGNFRTGISGRDLNRVFYTPQHYNEINIIRSLASKYNPYMYLDFHGHSAKKNVFMYGPDYNL
jgi:murein tripeptide amidase MpaA